MSIIAENLRQFGLNNKEIKVYLSLVSTGPSPVRKIVDSAGVNRGTTYDILKSLLELGLVSTYDQYKKQDKRQYFAAEDPEKLITAIENKQNDLAGLKDKVQKSLPELKELFNQNGEKPVVKYYEGNAGIKAALQDVLSAGKEYCVYSASDIRKRLYEAYPNFNKDRLKKKIKVKVIAIGKGGELAGLDARKWLSKQETTPTYVIIYSGKVAMISSKNVLAAAVIEDKGFFETQKMLFDFIWSKL